MNELACFLARGMVERVPAICRQEVDASNEERAAQPGGVARLDTSWASDASLYRSRFHVGFDGARGFRLMDGGQRRS